MEPKKRPHRPNPQAKANCLSNPLFCWLSGVFQSGSQRPLQEADLYDVLPEDSSIKLSNTLSRQWEKELYKAKTGSSFSLQSALYRCYSPAIVGLSILFFLVESLRVTQAVFLGLIVKYFEDNNSSPGWFLAYMYCIGWCLCYILVTVLDNVSLHKSLYTGLKMKVAVTSVIYRKILRLNQYSLRDKSASDVVRLLSGDANSFDQSCLAISYIWLAPLETVAVMVILWLYVGIGPYCCIGLIIIIVLTPIKYAMGTYMSKLRKKVSYLTERRLRQMSDILAGIKCIKMNCWEKPFSTLIHTVRRSEYTYLRIICRFRGINTAIYSVTSKLFVFSTFTVYMLLGNPVSPSLLLTTMALYEVLRSSMSLLWPWSLMYITESNKALKNIQQFLLLEERNTLETPAQFSLLQRSPLPENVVLRFEDYTASWDKDKENKKLTLAELNFSVHKGQLVVITGSTGCGKTSILNSVLGELPRLGGFVRSKGKLGFIPQNNWVFSSTFRENVMFGLDMDRRKYNKVLYACGLVKDLDSLPYNDLTVIGERGHNLTEGQKAKIGLARAVYQGADVYLVDDIFSVIDNKEAIHIFTKCFCGLVSTKTIILVTHHPQFLKAADTIVVVKKGKIAHHGGYEDLQRKGVSFKDILPDSELDELLANDSTNNTMDKESTTMRQKLWLDHFYSSQETLDKVWLQFEDTKDSDMLTSEGDKEQDTTATWETFTSYFRTGGGLCGIIPFAVFSLFAQVTYILCDWWLYRWSTSQWDIINPSPTHTNTTTPPSVPMSTTPASWLSTKFTPPTLHFFIYLGLFLGYMLLVFTRNAVFSSLATRASKKLHSEMFRCVLRASVTFFDRNSTGKILGRFGRDLSYVDSTLPGTLADILQFTLLVVGAVVMIAVANYWLVIGIVPLAAVFMYGQFTYMTTAKSLKQLQISTKTPVYQHLNNTLEGMWTVHAFGVEDRFLRYFDTYMDRHTAASYLYLALNRWFAIRMDLLSVFLVSLLAFVSVAVKGFTYIDPGLLGLAMLYCVNLLGLAQCSVRQTVELHNQMCGVGRILKYCDVKTESPIITPTRPSPVWPQYGILTFEGVNLVYGEDNIRGLRNMWCCFRSEEKVGVVGHPEICKRALVAAILRLGEGSGTIRIDGIDITDIGLQDLREKITVIPMEPVIFGGSMRRNLDPFSRHPDVHLWKALDIVQLKDKVESLPGQMYADMVDYGNNFSLGERQLVCLARALLRPSKVLIYEETPSIIDPRCEKLIHHIIHSKFKASTVIIIAQRLQGIIDTDRVMVLVDGKVKEFDPPHTLLENPKSQFYRLLHNQAQHRLHLYKQIAKDRYENKPYTPPPQSLGGDGVMPYAGQNNYSNKAFLPSFHNNRISGVLNNFGGNRFSANRF